MAAGNVVPCGAAVAGCPGVWVIGPAPVAAVVGIGVGNGTAWGAVGPAVEGLIVTARMARSARVAAPARMLAPPRMMPATALSRATSRRSHVCRRR